MQFMKKILCVSFVILLISLTGCNFSTGGTGTDKQNTDTKTYKLNITDYNNIILNKTELCETNCSYGLIKVGEEITFEIKFFSGLSATLSIDGKGYIPTCREAWENEFIKFTMPNHDVDVVSLINGNDGNDDKQVPTGQFKLNIIDEHNYIYDKPLQDYFTPFTEIVLHSYPLMDVDMALYVNGEFYSKQTSIESNDGYIWEYRFTMPISEVTLEFKVESSSGVKEQFFTYEFYVNADYGLHIENTATILFGGCLPFFNAKEYGIVDKLIIGTKVKMVYSGELEILEIYPSIANTSNIKIIDISYTLPNIYEYEMTDNQSGEKSLFASDSEKVFNGNYNNIYVINKDGSFVDLDTVEVGNKVYLVTNYCKNGNEEHVGFYSYNPLVD